jgi:hypothetical protein
MVTSSRGFNAASYNYAQHGAADAVPGIVKITHSVPLVPWGSGS